MTSLDKLTNTAKRVTGKRVGRGPGSGKGKTCGRGEKGAGARSGYKRRLGYEGGQFRTFMKLPIRGFSNAMFRKPKLDIINLAIIQELFEDGETVSVQTLIEKGYIDSTTAGIKVLAGGELTKKVKIEAQAISAGAREKLHLAKIPVDVPEEK